jgi:hypothetical protein
VRFSLHSRLACVVSLTVFCIYARAGRLLLLATGSLLVMIDLDTEGRPVPQHGLFRAFRSATSLGECVLACRLCDTLQLCCLCGVVLCGPW